MAPVCSFQTIEEVTKTMSDLITAGVIYIRWSQFEHLRLPRVSESSDGEGGERAYMLFPASKRTDPSSFYLPEMTCSG